jgi:hypothetical protein
MQRSMAVPGKSEPLERVQDQEPRELKGTAILFEPCTLSAQFCIQNDSQVDPTYGNRLLKEKPHDLKTVC